MSDALRRRRRLTAIARRPPQYTHLLAATTSSQLAAVPSRLRLHAAGYSATATGPVRTSERHVNVLTLTLLTVLLVVRQHPLVRL